MDFHPLMKEIASLGRPIELDFLNVERSLTFKFNFEVKNSAPYFILRSHGPKVFLLLIPSTVLTSNLDASLWEHMSVFYGENPKRATLLLKHMSYSNLEAGVPANLMEFQDFIRRSQTIFLPLEQAKNLQQFHLSHSPQKSPLFVTAMSSDRLYDVDLSQESLLSPLFHHFKDTQKLLSKTTRKKTTRHLRLFFNHFKLVAQATNLEKAVYKKSLGKSITYARLFIHILKDISKSLKNNALLALEGPSHEPKRTLEAPQPKKTWLSSFTSKPLTDDLLHFLTVEPVFAQRHFICPMCYELKVSKESLGLHFIEEHFKEKLRSIVVSFWSENPGKCNMEHCSVTTQTENEMSNHLGLDHELVFKLFLQESANKIQPCLVRDCSFRTLGMDSLLNHLIFMHHYEELVKQLEKVQLIQQFSDCQCPVFYCQKFVMKQKLLSHYALEHGALLEFIQKPSGDDVTRFIEVALHLHIRTKFNKKYTCDLPPCQSRPIFSYYVTYLLHLSEVHYADECKSHLMSYLKKDKCIYGNCNFSSSSIQTLILHVAVVHDVVLSIDCKMRKKEMERFNFHLLRMYDGLWKVENCVMYSYGSQSFRRIASLFTSLGLQTEGIRVQCIPCQLTLRDPSNSKGFYDELIYHSLSKEHILNYYLLSKQSPYEPVPVQQKESNFCSICGLVPKESHHLQATHQNMLLCLCQYLQFCSFRGVNPLTCSLSEVKHFVEHLSHTNEQLDLRKCLKVISRLHQKGSELLSCMDDMAAWSSRGIPESPTLFSCITCIFFASNMEQIRGHLSTAAHLKKIAESTSNYMRCEACDFYFLMSPSLLDIHRHSPAHLCYEYNLKHEALVIPFKKKMTTMEMHKCFICELQLDPTEFDVSHVSSPFHLEMQTLADSYYAHCESLSVNPVTCESSILKTIFLLYDPPQRRSLWKLLHRIHSGMDLTALAFAREPSLAELPNSSSKP